MISLLTHKQVLTFVNVGPWTWDNQEKDRGHYQPGGPNFTIKPDNKIQEAPDWIRHTPMFEMATKAGLIVEVQRVNPTAAPLPGVPMPDGYELAPLPEEPILPGRAAAGAPQIDEFPKSNPAPTAAALGLPGASSPIPHLE